MTRIYTAESLFKGACGQNTMVSQIKDRRVQWLSGSYHFTLKHTAMIWLKFENLQREGFWVIPTKLKHALGQWRLGLPRNPWCWIFKFQPYQDRVLRGVNGHCQTLLYHFLLELSLDIDRKAQARLRN